MNGTPSEYPAEPRQPHLHPRAVPWDHALAWYEEAMRLFKRAPFRWVCLAIATVLTEVAAKTVPGVGTLLSQLVTPLVGCGLIYGAVAADRGSKPSLRDPLRAFRAPPQAIAAIIASALVAFFAEAFAAWWIADVNLLDAAGGAGELSSVAVTGILALGILASLPVMFVVFHVLFQNVRPAPAFIASWNAFVLNTLPLLVYSAASMVLLGFSIATLGLGFALALPLWAASSYAAWKDIFGIRDAPA
ncbi:MAG TPA: hypothetical protein VFJ68_04110 [Casimicrobiaceae bacterium]|nr:hypothetical protein [Casimicrobiaceae bacterium]